MKSQQQQKKRTKSYDHFLIATKQLNNLKQFFERLFCEI